MKNFFKAVSKAIDIGMPVLVVVGGMLIGEVAGMLAGMKLANAIDKEADEFGELIYKTAKRYDD